MAKKQVCKAHSTSIHGQRRIWLTRHGESEYNRLELLGGDSNITDKGEKYARAMPEKIVERLPKCDNDDDQASVAVWTSTLKRTIQTARHLPFPKLRWKALDEIDAGICDGLTYEQVSERMPEEYAARKKDKLKYRYPSGESYMDVVQRLEPVIIELERSRSSVVVVAHQAVLRVIYGYFMRISLADIPSLAFPLHTVVELTPLPDGKMGEHRIPVDITQVPDSSADSLPPVLDQPMSEVTSAPATPLTACNLHEATAVAAGSGGP